MSKDSLLNSKGEYGNNSITRLTVQVDSWESRKRARMEEESDEMLKKEVERFRTLKKKMKSNPTETKVEEREDPDHISMAEGGRGPGVNTLTGTLCNIVNEASTEPKTIYDEEEPILEQNVAPEPVSDDIITVAEGGGAPGVHTLTGTLCNIVLRPDAYDDETIEKEEPAEPASPEDIEDRKPTPTHEYETDEDEFQPKPDSNTVACQDTPALDPIQGSVKQKNTAKRNRSAQGELDLAYFNLWWARMHIEGRKEAKMLRKEEEEEKVAKRKRKWSEYRSVRSKKRMAEDVEPEMVSKVIESPANVNQLFEFTEGGSLPEGGNYREGGIVVGVRQPSEIICEQSLSLRTPDHLKYGTSRDFDDSSMGPGPTVANLVERAKHPEERDSGLNLMS